MKAYGIARIGRDAEVRSGNGEPVMNLSLAFSYGRKGDGGSRPTQWVEAVMWGKRAESLAPYLVKGSQILVDLEDVHTEVYAGKTGEKTKLVARVGNIELISSRQPGEPVQAAAPTRQAAIVGSGFDDMDSDIPF
jgi:single-strand DNA-binding protein